MLSTNTEVETALCGVRIDRERMPRHRICPYGQSTDTDSHHIAADALAPVHTRARRIPYFCPTEFRFELLREVECDLPRRASNCTANRRACMIEHSVGLKRCCKAHTNQKENDKIELTHGHCPDGRDADANSGLPMELGKMSSR